MTLLFSHPIPSHKFYRSSTADKRCILLKKIPNKELNCHHCTKTSQPMQKLTFFTENCSIWLFFLLKSFWTSLNTFWEPLISPVAPWHTAKIHNKNTWTVLAYEIGKFKIRYHIVTEKNLHTLTSRKLSRSRIWSTW